MSQELKLEIVFNQEGWTSIMGGDDSNPTWDEYLQDVEDKYIPHMELLKSAILDKKNELYQITGEQKQGLGVSFKFSDGNHWSFSWRAWGDLMQAIVGKREGYMTYYM